MDHIDKAIDFLDNLEKLGNQLQRAASQQQLFLSRMLELSRAGDESSEEYLTLQQQSQNLQAMIDKWKPIYEERLAMVREVRRKKYFSCPRCYLFHNKVVPLWQVKRISISFQ